MYAGLRDTWLRLMRVDLTPPETPAGTPGSEQVFRASPNYLKYRLAVIAILAALCSFGVVMMFIGGVVGGEPVLVALAVVLALALAVGISIAYVAARIDYELRYYVITDRALRIRGGAMVVRENTLTYANIQNLRITQGPIERALGIRNVVVDSAGGGSAPGQGGGGRQVMFAGVENAQEVRDSVLSRVRLCADTGLGDDDDGARAGAAAGPRVVAALEQVLHSAKALRETCEEGA